MRRPVSIAIALLLLAALWPGTASADGTSGSPGPGRTRTFDVPSRFVDADAVAVGPPAPGEPARANNLGVVVRLPAGYARHPKRRYPVLFLLHGASQAYDHWAAKGYGDIAGRTRGFPGIVVMPQGGVVGFYSDWYDGGRRTGPGWESYYLRELIPAIEKRYRIRQGRRWHAIAGLSMGGYGSFYLASQLPGYFGSAASFSGVLSPQDDKQLDVVAQTVLPLALPGFTWRDVFGPAEGFYAKGHNPSLLLDNLRHTRLFVSAGNATPCAGDDALPTDFVGLGPQATALFQPPLAAALGPPLFIALEKIVRTETDRFLVRAQAAGLHPRTLLGCGIHWWDTFNREFDTARRWGFFKRTEARPTHWRYVTTQRRARAWGLALQLDRAPTTAIILTRQGRTLRATGRGVLRITTPGCRTTAKLPFQHRLTRRCVHRLG